MARQESNESIELTELQTAVLRVLWSQGEATVGEVQRALRGERELAQTTVATLLTRLERRGVVAHRAEGRQYVYRATVSEGEVQRTMVSGLTERLFGGKPAALVNHLLSTGEIEAGDLARVKALIESKQRELEDHDVA